MPDETTLAQAPTPTPPPVHIRVGRGMRRTHNWVQLVKFCGVGASGYAANLATFAIANSAFGLHRIPSATLAFVVAVFNNFWWNRHWTFGAGDGHAGFQAARFFAVSLVAFGFQIGILEVCHALGLGDFKAQAVSIVAATPLNFVGNKMWSFGRSRSRR